MQLHHQRHASAFQPLDHPQLPERARAIERPLGDAPHELGEDPIRSRSGRLNATQVLLDADLRVFDPDGVLEVEGNAS